MHTKIKTLVLGGLLAGSLIVSAAPAMAKDHHYDRDHYRWYDRDYRSDVRDSRHDWWDNWRWGDRWDNRWDRRDYGYGRGYNGSSYTWQDVQRARDKALSDARNGASRKKIAQDNAVVDQMLNNMGYPSGYDSRYYGYRR